MVKKISRYLLSKIHLSGFFKKTIGFGRKIYSKIHECQRLLRKVKQNSKVEKKLKAKLQGMFSLFCDALGLSKLFKFI